MQVIEEIRIITLLYQYLHKPKHIFPRAYEYVNQIGILDSGEVIECDITMFILLR